MDGRVRVAALAEGVGAFSGNPPAVREESHLDEMRSAIRGDFERLAERRGDQELMRITDDDAGPPDAESPQPPDAVDHAEPPGERRSWFARFASP